MDGSEMQSSKLPEGHELDGQGGQFDIERDKKEEEEEVQAVNNKQQQQQNQHHHQQQEIETQATPSRLDRIKSKTAPLSASKLIQDYLADLDRIIYMRKQELRAYTTSKKNRINANNDISIKDVAIPRTLDVDFNQTSPNHGNHKNMETNEPTFSSLAASNNTTPLGSAEIYPTNGNSHQNQCEQLESSVDIDNHYYNNQEKASQQKIEISAVTERNKALEEKLSALELQLEKRVEDVSKVNEQRIQQAASFERIKLENQKLQLEDDLEATQEELLFIRSQLQTKSLRIQELEDDLDNINGIAKSLAEDLAHIKRERNAVAFEQLIETDTISNDGSLDVDVIIDSNDQSGNINKEEYNEMKERLEFVIKENGSLSQYLQDYLVER